MLAMGFGLLSREKLTSCALGAGDADVEWAPINTRSKADNTSLDTLLLRVRPQWRAPVLSAPIRGVDDPPLMLMPILDSEDDPPLSTVKHRDRWYWCLMLIPRDVMRSFAFS